MSRKKLKIIDQYPSTLGMNALPTYADIIKAIHSINRSATESWKIVRKSVVDDLMNVWNHASLPIVDKKTIMDKVSSAHQRYLKLCSSDSRRGFHKGQVREFKVISGTSERAYSGIVVSNGLQYVLFNKGRRGKTVRYLHVQMREHGQLYLREASKGSTNRTEFFERPTINAQDANWWT